MRQIILDTETTGLEPSEGHRIIEIGAVVLEDRRLTGEHFHQYLNPDREIDAGAIEVHGITNEFLVDKPRFADIAEDLLRFIEGDELIIHNAPFDVGFLDHELRRLRPDWDGIAQHCTITDSLVMARRKHPGQRNSLDALCKRYHIDNSHRELHGALLDAEILADVYLAMTGGQASLSLEQGDEEGGDGGVAIRRLDPHRPPLRVVRASADEIATHEARLNALDKASGGPCVWRREAAAP